MPKGVICAGAVEGSNQLGAIVTCHAMTARPEGAGPSAPKAAATKMKLAANSEAINAGRQRRPCHRLMPPLPFFARHARLPDRRCRGGLSASRVVPATSFGEVPKHPHREAAVQPGRPAGSVGAERPEREAVSRAIVIVVGVGPVIM